MKSQTKKINKTKGSFFEKFDIFDKSLAKLMRIEGAQDGTPPQNVPLWHMDYFKLKAC